MHLPLATRSRSRARWIRLAIALLALPLPVVGGCSHGDRAYGQTCKSNADCQSNLVCLKPPRGAGVCTFRCGPAENPRPRPGQPQGATAAGSCPGAARCLRVQVEVVESGCNRTYRGNLEASYCVPPAQADQALGGKRFRVRLK